MPQDTPLNWTNNPNDLTIGQSTTVITAKVKGNQGSGTDLLVDNFTQYDSDGNPSLNWAAGDEFTITNVADDDDDTIYTIESIVAGSGSGAAKEWTINHTPTLKVQADDNATVTKEDSYKGNQRSAENHCRLRNMGLI